VKRIPHVRGVTQALRSVREAAQKSLQGVNRVASQRMVKGDYSTAEALAARGKEIRQFQSEVETLRKRWRELCGVGGQSAKQSGTPLWVYFQPILQGLVQAGGESRRVDLETRVGSLVSSSLQLGEPDALAGGHERWRVMIRRARKHLVAEGWIEDRTGPIWRITEAGRKAAVRRIGKEALR
jgi:hypothetical protein